MNKQPVETIAKKHNTQAPGQFYGYALQESRCLVHLLKSLNIHDFISVEFIDDVATHNELNETVIVEQTTSSSSRNPISDRNPKLWKTFFNWVKYVKEG